MRFLSNFGCKITFICSVNFWHQQNYNSLGSISHVTSKCKRPIAYAHILRDSNDNAMTVCLDETVTITETMYKISVETYNEIQEDSLRRALVPLHADDNYQDDDEEATLEPFEAEETPAYQDQEAPRPEAKKRQSQQVQ